MQENQLIHHHLIYQSQVNRLDLDCNAHLVLEQFLYDLVEVIGMKVLIKPQLAFSNLQAWSGIIGIVTSHIAFHYWTIEGYVQLDIYSCKNFDIEKTIAFLNNFWEAKNVKALFIKREFDNDFVVKRIGL